MGIFKPKTPKAPKVPPEEVQPIENDVDAETVSTRNSRSSLRRLLGGRQANIRTSAGGIASSRPRDDLENSFITLLGR